MRINIPLILATVIVAGSLSTAIVVLDAQSVSKAPEAVSPTQGTLVKDLGSTALSKGAASTLEDIRLRDCSGAADDASCIRSDAEGLFLVTPDFLNIRLRPCQGDSDYQCVKPVENQDHTWTLFLS